MKYKKLVGDAFAYAFSGYLVQPIAIASSILVKRWLGPYLVGVTGVLALVNSYTTFANLGVLSAAERDLPFLHGADEAEKYRRVRDSSFVAAAAAGIISGALIAGWAIYEARVIGAPLLHGLLVYAGLAVLQQIAFYYITVLRAEQSFAFLSRNQIVMAVFSSLVNIAGARYYGFNGFLSAASLTAMVQILLLDRARSCRPGIQWRAIELRELAASGVPLLIFGCTMTGMRTVDNMMVLKLLGTKELGLYSIALMSNNTLFTLTNTLSGVLYPRMQKAYGREKTVDALSRYVVRPTLVMATVLPALIAGIYFLVPPIVLRFLPRFAEGLPAFRIITLATYFFAMFQMASGFLVSLKKQNDITLILILGLACTVVLSMVLTRCGLGLNGVAYAVGVGYACCYCGVNLRALLHWTSLRRALAFLARAALPFVYSAVLILALDAIGPLSQGDFTMRVASAFAKLAMFGVGSIPLWFWMESGTGLLEDVVAPAWRALRAAFRSS